MSERHTKETELNIKIGQIRHVVHVDRELSWTLDSKVDPNTIFRKIKKIAQDDCGTVFELLYIPSDSHIVGKTANTTTFNAKNMELIKQEFKTMSKIVSEFITRYYGSVILNGNLTFLMEFYEHGSIRDIIDTRMTVLTESQTSFVIRDLLKALSLLHEKNKIVHRDIRAANIFLSSTSTSRVSVFGFTRCFDARQESTLPIVVTPYWMSPERINDDQCIIKSDIWSTGITAIECVVGAPPYIEMTSTRAMLNISQNGINGHFPLKEKFSDEFVDFVSKCTELDHMKRPSANELLEHPFIKKTESLNKVKVMKPLLQFMNELDNVDDGDDDDNDDDDKPVDEEFNEKTKDFIEKYKALFRNNH